MKQTRLYKSFFVFVFLVTTLFFEKVQARDMCIDLFKATTKMVEITNAHIEGEPVKASSLEIKLAPLSANKDVALAQIIEMATLTPDILLTEKSAFRDNRLKLGILLEHGYSLEVVYKADFREKPSFTFEGSKIISPSNRSEIISKNHLEYQELALKENTTYDLSDIYPNGSNIIVKLPAVIEGPALAEFRKMLPRFEFQTKEEIRENIKTKSMTQFKLITHRKALTGFMGEYFYKGIFKTTIKLVFIPIMVVAGLHYKPEIEAAYNYMTNTPIEWVVPTVKRLETTLPAELKPELQGILAGMAPALTGASEVNLKNNLDAPRLRISATQHAWVSQGSDKLSGIEKTYLIISQDNEKGAIEYFAVEINPIVHSKLIAHFKTEGKLIKASATATTTP